MNVEFLQVCRFIHNPNDSKSDGLAMVGRNPNEPLLLLLPEKIEGDWFSLYQKCILCRRKELSG
jgi:hypothetical protein